MYSMLRKLVCNECARSAKFFWKGGDSVTEGGVPIGGGQVQEGGGLTTEGRCPPPSPPSNRNPGHYLSLFLSHRHEIRGEIKRVIAEIFHV